MWCEASGLPAINKRTGRRKNKSPCNTCFKREELREGAELREGGALRGRSSERAEPSPGISSLVPVHSLTMTWDLEVHGFGFTNKL